jgi:hypothetical protein
MKINRAAGNNGKIYIYGNGSVDEVDSLNKVSGFNKALRIMEKLRRRKEGLFGIHFGNSVKRKIYGKRKNTG